ncbi:2-keto-4-pentenoate hydratase [[Kitasatospora] papulosa]|uniref:2-keto-4-pentenoate hydratase n=1 Tax=[Kitasatospora] papulosa TaxID=1464011 RepID=UPI003628150B
MALNGGAAQGRGPGAGEEVLAGLARDLSAAARTRAPIRLLSERFADLTLEDAYRIQQIGTAMRVSAGDRVAGHKLGLTSVAMQEQMGIDEPDSGVVLDSMLGVSGCALPAADFMSPRIETEIAFRLGEDLSGPANVHRIGAALAEVFLAFEVLDTVYTSWGLTLVDSIADNAACAGVITGSPVPFTPDLDLATEQVTVQANGTAAATGTGRDILGNPLEALVWLTHRLPMLGTTLRAGDIVLAGSVHASLPLTPGTDFRATSTRLPAVNLHVT